MRGHAVHAMQREVFGEVSRRKNRFSVDAFMRGASAKRMWFSTSARIWRGLVVGEAEAAADIGADCDADLDVAVEADAIGCYAESGRLADIVQQSAPASVMGQPGSSCSSSIRVWIQTSPSG